MKDKGHMSKPYFIDKEINILTGQKALEALREENDVPYLSKDKGVVRVTTERWKKAQECERNHWLKRGIKTANDRNDYHYKQFDGYEQIRNKSFHSMLEIGCGPFTNSRMIAGLCNVANCTLLDPLIYDYLNHPFCFYSDKYLFSEYVPFLGKVIRKILPFLFRLYLNILSRKTKIKELLNITGETISLRDQYDLVIMINVIEHCYDVELVFQNILKIVQKDGYFIFEDKYYDYENILSTIKNSYDTAHPLKVDRKVVEQFLKENFEVIYKRIQTNTMIFEGENILWEDVYYIGRKK
jgi:SAM-dependent methyltransferase